MVQPPIHEYTALKTISKNVIINIKLAAAGINNTWLEPKILITTKLTIIAISNMVAFKWFR